MDWKTQYQEKLRTPAQAVQVVRNGDRIYAGTSSSIAYPLIDALYQRRDELEGVVLCHGMINRQLPIFTPEAKGHFSTTTYFAGAGCRTGIQNGLTTFTSFHLSQIDLWCREVARPNIAFLEVSPPDEEGYMSYGAYGTTFHDYVRELADTVVLQVNPNAPYVYGEKNKIHISQADIVVEAADQSDMVPNLPLDETLETLSSHIVALIPDGATLQLGLGGISNAVGFGLREKNDLGIHTEMYTDSMMELTKLGVVTNRRKSFLPGKAVTSFALGTRALYDYVDHNPDFHFAPFSFVNDPYTIARNDNMISVNTAMAVDLYGQVRPSAWAANSRAPWRAGGLRPGRADVQRRQVLYRADQLAPKKRRLQQPHRLLLPGGNGGDHRPSDVQYVATEYGLRQPKGADHGRPGPGPDFPGRTRTFGTN